MSGHSKWANIKHKKEKTDKAKAKIFTKIGKELTIAVKEGGPDPASNAKLRDLIQKAKANNVPNENIERTIKKAEGTKGESFEEITYEGYGPAGVAVIVVTSTDNRNRTAGNVRSYFSKYHGNMGTSGCVSFMFEDKGMIVINDEDGDYEPSVITRYILDVATAFNRFYHECSIFNAEDEGVKATRLALTAATKHVLGSAFGLICLRKTEKI